ncbi:MAG: hypothetical protein HQM13_13665 [SAR324 cluster bacterium]|nr:hypothetical protein [SAR324 cluster bacterium]
MIRVVRMLSMLLTLPVLAFSIAMANVQVKGKIQSISNRAKTIQMLDIKAKKNVVVRFGDQTKYVNAKSIKEFIVNDVIIVNYEEGKEVDSIKRVLAEVPGDQLITTQELSQVLQQSPDSYVLVDARPGAQYNLGHLPGAVSIPVGEVSKSLSAYPKDKLLVFYCGGPT